jgi:hypothetical protein
MMRLSGKFRILLLDYFLGFVFRFNQVLHVEDERTYTPDPEKEEEDARVVVQDAVSQNREKDYHQRSTDPVSRSRKRHYLRLNNFRYIQPHHWAQRYSEHSHIEK